MMAGNYGDRSNAGALFKNERKEKDTHPDYKGDAIINGVEYWLDAWINTAQKTGKKYLGMKFNPKEVLQDPPGGDAPVEPDDDADDLPF